ncbi:MAG: SpoIIE family protein phosphatase [Solidesulfovibrio sp.]
MRIRTKLLCILLALVLPPLLAVSFYALREAKLLGHELARRAADSYTQSAKRELALMVDLIGEDVGDNRQMLELSLAFLGREADRAMSGPPTPAATGLFAEDFDAAGAMPPDHSPSPGATPPAALATADVPTFSLPPELARVQAEQDAARLTGMLPTLATLRQKLGSTLLWAYVALPNGLLCSFPGHGPMPAGYDARTRPWYKEALARKGPAWSIIADATTGRLTATVSAPIYKEDGMLLGVAGIDAPLEAMLPESDLSKRWGDGVRALVVYTLDRAGTRAVAMLGSRDFLGTSQGWEAPLKPSPLDSPDPANLVRLADAIDGNRSDQLDLTLGDAQYFAVFKPFPDTPAGLLVLVPRQAVLEQADSAEASILARTRLMMAVVISFALFAVGFAIVLAFFGARAVTRPISALCGVAGRLAQGDLSARAAIPGKDELAQLAGIFNSMAPKLTERLRLKQDMLLAMEVQQNLLPKAPPTLPGLDIAGATFFCDETGGDYFDYLQFMPAGATACDVVLGDVTGHGISAALFMATGRALLRGGRDADQGPAALLTLVNGLLCQDTSDSGRFLTLFFLRLENGGVGPRGSLVWSRAGHDPALVYDPATDDFEELMGPGIPLGVLPEFVYEEQARPGLAPGQVLVIGTDGIWEARCPEGEMYGKDRFRDVMRRHASDTAETIIAAVVKDVTDFQASAPRDDDITLVVVKALAI